MEIYKTRTRVRYIYLLVDPDAARHRFKIGMSFMPGARANAVCGAFCRERSFQVGYEKDDARLGEAILHKRFAAYRLPVTESRDGKTEWFSLDCYEEAASIVRGGRYVVPPELLDSLHVHHLTVSLPGAAECLLLDRMGREGTNLAELASKLLHAYAHGTITL